MDPGSDRVLVIGPLTDPRAHGGDPADAFHLVVGGLSSAVLAQSGPASSTLTP
ncbi:hypothetical protein [Nocardia crassostreae]|uniref:hypothetical protein n=1 Tax=Nocardia crassostreae TaxID=53428 RepID=UPI000B2191D7|nr:hypothetical protein [Nocardia crassostreae]